MSIELPGAETLDYLPCRYGESKLLFRGPKRLLEGAYLAFLGGTETYGKFVSQPFPNVVERMLDVPCINLGCPNAGLDSFVNDVDLLNIASRAELTVFQLPGAHNLSNRFFRVHPRRNDRFLQPSPILSAIYREVDFTEFNFTKHMLGRLQMLSPDRFDAVRDELQQAWLGRMRLLLNAINSSTVLLWLRVEEHVPNGALGPDPIMVTDEMVDALRDLALDVVEVTVTPAGPAQDMEGMVFGHMDAPAAMQMPGPSAHDRIADKLTTALRAAL